MYVLMESFKLHNRPMMAADAVSVTRVDLVGLYHAFRNVCIEHGLSAQRVGEALGIQSATLSRMHRGKIKDIRAHSMLKMCEWANLNPRDFLVEDRVIIATKLPKE